MARRGKAKEAAAKRRAPAALPSPASSSEEEEEGLEGGVEGDVGADEAPERVSFGVARAAAAAERRLQGEAARRHRELQKEKRRRHQELFAEQKKRRLLPEAVLQELQELQELQDVAATADPPAGEAERAPADDQVTSDEEPEDEAEEQKQGQGQAEMQVKKGKGSKSARSKGNYMAVCLKDQSSTGLHQQLAQDFLKAQLYGPHTNRVQANEFFSIANKKDPVKKAAVQFVDKSWGQEKKEKAARFKKRWIATQTKN